jgi:transmembrane sensor
LFSIIALAAWVKILDDDAWRDDQMAFEDATAAALVEVNRYGGREVVVGNPSLGELRVSRTFHTNRPQAFV